MSVDLLQSKTALPLMATDAISQTGIEAGRISMPGLSADFSMTAYLPLVHLYTQIVEASRVLDRYRGALSTLYSTDPQAPLTPLMPSTTTPHLLYKREDMTATQAYKVRGAVVAMAKAMQYGHKAFDAVSTGNHALGVLKAAELLKPNSVRMVMPQNTAPYKLRKIQEQVSRLQHLGINARCIQVGNTFDEAREWALTNDDSAYYIDPYSDPWVVAGQGTIGLELLHQLAPYANAYESILVVAPVGGGGLLSGTATGIKMAKAWDPRFRHLNVNFLGLRLADPNSELGDAIRVNDIAAQNKDRFDAWQVAIRKITDAQMIEGQARVLADLGAKVEGPCGATVSSSVLTHSYQPSSSQLVVSLLSGGNVKPV